MQEHFKISDIFSEATFDRLKKTYYEQAKFKRIETEVDFCFLHRVTGSFSNTLISRINQETGLELKEIVTVARLNDVDKDTGIRIHSDAEIIGQHPTWASIFYLETDPEGGTALYHSKTKGDRTESDYKVYYEVDDFEVKHINYAERNSLFLYKANLFHGRYPFHYPKRRIVIVSFFN